MIKSFSRVTPAGETVTAEEFQRLQDNLEEVLKPVTEQEPLDGHLIDVTLDTSYTNISHKLGREWRGWIVADKDQLARLQRHPTDIPDKTKFIRLRSQIADTDVRLWVF